VDWFATRLVSRRLVPPLDFFFFVLAAILPGSSFPVCCWCHANMPFTRLAIASSSWLSSTIMEAKSPASCRPSRKRRPLVAAPGALFAAGLRCVVRRLLARGRWRGEVRHTLQATALDMEAYLRPTRRNVDKDPALVGDKPAGHFFRRREGRGQSGAISHRNRLGERLKSEARWRAKGHERKRR